MVFFFEFLYSLICMYVGRWCVCYVIMVFMVFDVMICWVCGFSRFSLVMCYVYITMICFDGVMLELFGMYGVVL